MQKIKWRTIIYYAIPTLIGAAMTALILDTHDLSAAENVAERYRILCDAFTVPGVVLILFGVLLILSSKGAFDGIGYAAKHAIRMLIPGRGGIRETYREYLDRKHSDDKAPVWRYPIIPGAVYFIISLIFLVLFYKQ